ncbi:helix-turn-helix transcriptional regulator [Streptomyces sp. NPDC002399]
MKGQEQARTGPFEAARGLGEIDLAVYGWVLEHRTGDPGAVAEATAIAPEEAALSLERLRRARLLHAQSAAGESPGLFAVAPETALAQLAAPVEAKIREQQDGLAGMRQDLGPFVACYHRRHSRSESLELLENVQDVRNTLNQASNRCRFEVLTSQPGGGARDPEAMREALVRDQSMLERGIRLRTLYHHTARFNGPSQAYVAAASALGGQYRTAHELFGRLIVFDRELAFIPVRDDSWGAVVIREPSTVGYLCEIFEQAWDRSTPFADAAGQGLEGVSREIHETIVRLLGAGLKDEAIARRLGMSLRTARRHIADIMEELDATSRFQAGAHAVARGLLPDTSCAEGPSGGSVV